ncbi:MAG: MerR family transcriptional regulator [Bryobacteraceae bacterium]
MTPGSDPLLSISGLVKLSGAHRQTIHFYLRKGVLPLPLRVGRTSALYRRETVELIKLVKSAQDSYRLSLEEIARLFRQAGYDATRIRRDLASAGAATLPTERRPGTEPPPPAAFIEEAARAGLLEESRDGRHADDSALAAALWEGKRLGVPLEEFQTLSKRLDAEAARTVQEILAGLHTLRISGEADPRLGQLFNVFERFGSLRWRAAINRRFIECFERAWKRFRGSNLQTMIPSETFYTKLGLNKEIDRLHRHLSREPGDLKAMKELERAYHYRSDWVRIHDLCRTILVRDPDDPSILADYGYSLRLLGRLQEAVSALEDGLARTGNPLLKVRLGQTLVHQAAATGDAGQFLAAAIRRRRLAEQAIAESKKDPILSRRVRGILAVETILLTDPLGSEQPSPDDIQVLADELARINPKNPSPLARISLERSRLLAAYALYEARKRQGHPDAPRILRTIVKADPDCLLAVEDRAERAAGAAKSAASAKKSASTKVKKAAAQKPKKRRT